MRIDRTIPKGFTLIELLVVIAVIALLMAIIMPALGKAKLYAQRIVCSNHVRQQALGTLLYANENDSYVPNPMPYTLNGGSLTINGAWFWDISFWFTNELCEYAGFEKTDTTLFTCPSNKMRKPDDALWAQYTLTPGGPSPMPMQDEDTLSVAQQRANYRVGPYIYFMDRYVREYDSGRSRYDPHAAAPLLNNITVSGPPMEDLVVRRLSNTKAAGSKKMIMDAIISTSTLQFSGLTVGGIDELSDNTLTDDTNHLTRGEVTIGSSQSRKPLGANIAFADGHADWQPAGQYIGTEEFEYIEHKYTEGQWFWW